MLDAFLTRMPILPIDTGRYGSPEMRHIFDEESKLQKWLDVEAAVAEAEASVGDIPKEAADDIAENANIKTVTLARTKEIEKETRHDLMSMVMALTEACKGEGKKYVHYGLTSMDIEDTTTALQFKEAFDIIDKELDQLETILASMVRKYRGLLMVARTHGRHAGVITFGLKLAVWLSEIKRQKKRLRQVRERALVGKILGIVGTGAGLGKNALKIQEKALSRLGLKPAGLVTQVIQRDIHAEVVAYLALLGSSLDKFATEIRNLQRSEISEALEPFERKRQIGSSALPSKRNPELSERVSSLAKLLRGLTIPALENIPLWHERDLSNSANERFLFPMSFILTDEMLRLEYQVLKGLEVMPRSMERNLELSQGAVLAERVVNMLVEKGVARQDAHERVRKISMKSIDTGAAFVKILGDDAFVSKRLRPGEIKAALDYTSYLGVASQLINMALNE
ncbi:adenylosuccinate lyase [Candidatus Bathyarchaeota archaeon]|nr:MAG: adenylosuccinate lyase [Candidatus Bathyarchaeota archaeon]